MANGKPGDNPLTDLVLYGIHPFPADIEALLIEDGRGEEVMIDPITKRPLSETDPTGA